MIRLNIEILQNLRQVSLTFELPSVLHCKIRCEEILLENDENQTRSIIDLNGLRLEMGGASETSSTDSLRRTFKFPYVSLPNVKICSTIDFKTISCLQGHSILPTDQTFELVQQSQINPDDLSEVMFCHRFCDAHGHKHDKHYESPPSIDFHSNSILLESFDQLNFSSKFLSKDFFHNDRVECRQCSSQLGSFDEKTGLVSLNKCVLLPFATDFPSSSFRHCEPGRYIIKVPKSFDSLLIWILPNEILHGSICLSSCSIDGVVQYVRQRKILFHQVKTSDDALYNEWKRDFSVTTFLLNRLSFDFLLSRCIERVESWNSSDRFHSFSCSSTE